jgi:hypothetical protein
MLGKRAGWIGVGLTIALAWAVAQDRSQGEDKRRLLALETAWNHAEEAKNIVALDQLLHETLVYVDYDGSLMTKAEFLNSAKAPDLHPAQIVNDSAMANVYGDAAVVTGTYREKGVFKGKPYMRRGRFTDTWIQQNGTWQCVASQSTLIQGK